MTKILVFDLGGVLIDQPRVKNPRQLAGLEPGHKIIDAVYRQA